MTTENRRLLIAIDAEIKEVNRATINPRLPELTIADLRPAIAMVANARANYLESLHQISRKHTNGQPSDEDIEHLGRLRRIYEELLKATQALETAIERDYLDVRK